MSRISDSRLFLVILAFSVSVAGAQQSTLQSQPPPARDSQAIALLTQSLAAAGGAQALAALRDFTATGKITYFWTEQGDTGTVTVKSRGLNQFRLEASVSEGNRTATINNGDAWTKDPNGEVRHHSNMHVSNVGTNYMPFQEIAAALADTSLSIMDLGMVTEYGQQAHGVRIQENFARGSDPGGTRVRLSQRDIFIDPKTFLVVRTRDLARLRSQFDPSVLHDTTFSDYRVVNGVMFPFSVTECLIHQPGLTIHFDNVKFNGGLGDTDFDQ